MTRREVKYSSDDPLLSDKERFVEDAFSKLSPSSSCGKVCFFNGLKFLGKNMVAFGAGFVLGMIIRVCVGAASKKEPVIIKADSHGTELIPSDVVSCFTTLLICHFWIKPIKHYSSLCSDPKLLVRTALRDLIPFLFGLGIMVLVKWLEITINGPDPMIPGPNKSRVFGASDVVGGVMLLLLFHGVDRLLELKWRADPYEEIQELEEIGLSMEQPRVQ